MGRCIVAGGKPDMEAPVGGIRASELAVGSSVYLMWNGEMVEYLVVNQGKPSGSTLYDDSCNGTWLLSKDIASAITWDTTNNDYKNSDAHTTLNGSWLNAYGDIEKSTFKQVKIPYVNGIGGSGVSSGESGLLTTVFFLSSYEIGWTEISGTESNNRDGACLSYFSGDNNDSKRIAYYRGVANEWSTRSPDPITSGHVVCVDENGQKKYHSMIAYPTYYNRPAVVIPFTAVFGKNDLLLKGAK